MYVEVYLISYHIARARQNGTLHALLLLCERERMVIDVQMIPLCQNIYENVGAEPY